VRTVIVADIYNSFSKLVIVIGQCWAG